jgi:hypothetical protein
MNRRLIIYVPALAFLAILVILLNINLCKPPAWQVSLDQYLAFLHAQGEPSYRLATSVQAAHPEAFTSSMSAGSYNTGSAFLTDYTTAGDTAGLAPITFPPKDVWYALLKNPAHEQLVYIALLSAWPALFGSCTNRPTLGGALP